MNTISCNTAGFSRNHQSIVFSECRKVDNKKALICEYMADSIKLVDTGTEALLSVKIFSDTIGALRSIYFIDSTRVSFIFRLRSEKTDTIGLLITSRNGRRYNFSIASFTSKDICDSVDVIKYNNHLSGKNGYGLDTTWWDEVKVNGSLCSRLHDAIDLSMKLHKELGITNFELSINGSITMTNNLRTFKYKPEYIDECDTSQMVANVYGNWYITQNNKNYLKKRAKVAEALRVKIRRCIKQTRIDIP